MDVVTHQSPCDLTSTPDESQDVGDPSSLHIVFREAKLLLNSNFAFLLEAFASQVEIIAVW